jgi:hypothetical protein
LASLSHTRLKREIQFWHTCQPLLLEKIPDALPFVFGEEWNSTVL